jgi:Domain of unknown function (DUF4126)
MRFVGDQLVALLVAVSFAAGLNLYATVATLGILAHTGVLTLPGSLQLLGNWWVIGVSAALFAVEFFADKIPGFDVIWNSLHTFIRVPAAALLAYQATSSLSPWQQMAAAAAGGSIAMVAHSGKTAARVAVTASPEPLSNAALSFGGETLSVSLTWLATKHPYLAASIAGVLLVIIILLMRWVWRALRSMLRRGKELLEGTA